MPDKGLIRDRIAELESRRNLKIKQTEKLLYLLPVLLVIFIYLIEHTEELGWIILLGVVIAITSLYVGWFPITKEEDIKIHRNYGKLLGRE